MFVSSCQSPGEIALNRGIPAAKLLLDRSQEITNLQPTIDVNSTQPNLSVASPTPGPPSCHPAASSVLLLARDPSPPLTVPPQSSADPYPFSPAKPHVPSQPRSFARLKPRQELLPVLQTIMKKASRSSLHGMLPSQL